MLLRHNGLELPVITNPEDIAVTNDQIAGFVNDRFRTRFNRLVGIRFSGHGPATIKYLLQRIDDELAVFEDITGIQTLDVKWALFKGIDPLKTSMKKREIRAHKEKLSQHPLLPEDHLLVANVPIIDGRQYRVNSVERFNMIQAQLKRYPEQRPAQLSEGSEILLEVDSVSQCMEGEVRVVKPHIPPLGQIPTTFSPYMVDIEPRFAKPSTRSVFGFIR